MIGSPMARASALTECVFVVTGCGGLPDLIERLEFCGCTLLQQAFVWRDVCVWRVSEKKKNDFSG